jgi:hypothetical protein
VASSPVQSAAGTRFSSSIRTPEWLRSAKLQPFSSSRPWRQ